MGRRIWLMILSAVLIASFAGAEYEPSVMSSSIYKTEWRWNPGDTAEFEGNIICDHVSENEPLTISLSVDVVPGGTEVSPPVFRYVNGQKQSNRHPKSEVTVTSSEQAIRFSGGWELPANYRIDEATIHLKVYNRKEELLGESELRMNNDQLISGGSENRLPDTGRFIRYILIAAALIWVLALIRIYINRKRR